MNKRAIVIDMESGEVFAADKPVRFDCGDVKLMRLPPDSPEAVQWKLGVGVWESVAAKYRERIVGIKRHCDPPYDCETLDIEDGCYRKPGAIDHCEDLCIILGPEPKPRTDRKMLEELVEAWEEPVENAMKTINDKFRDAKKHLDETKGTEK